MPSGKVGEMNTLDIVIGVVCLGSAVLGVVLGPLRQVSKLGGLVLGLILAKKYAGWAQDAMRLRFVHGEAVAYVVVLVAVYVAARLIGYAVEYSLKGDKQSGSERLMGGLAGLVHGAALSVVIVFVLVAVSPRDASIFRESKAASPAVTAAGWAQGVFPKALRDAFREKAPAGRGGGSNIGESATPAPPSPRPKAAAPAEAKEPASPQPKAPASAQPKNRSRK